MKSEAYLNEIRARKNLQRAVLKKITVEGRTVVFHLVSDLTYGAEDVSFAEEVSRRYVPEGYTAGVKLMKCVPEPDGVRAAVCEILKTKFPAAAAFISPRDVEVKTDQTGGRFFLSVGAEEYNRFAHGEALDALSAELSRRFCGGWTGDYRIVEREAREIEPPELPPEEVLLAPRTFPISGFEAIDGATADSALYIADLEGEQKSVTVCGRVSYIEERLTRNEKPFFTLTVSDGSGQLRASYFSKKATLEKVRAVKQGDWVCLTGANELFNGAYRFTVRQIDRGAPPEGFEPQRRPSRPVPAKYVKVFPEPASDLVQANVFESRPLPDALTKGRFVVFDLETTGLNSTPVYGSMDHIIEIGAVKIQNGQICEKFSSFVACPVRLTSEIVSITGIEDEMLVGAPDVKDVMADFYKFCDGCVLVGHNVQFDCGFIRYYGEKEGYRFDHDSIDTVALSQAQLRLPNYKLNTVADHYGFSFHHHRAFDDAFVTAKIFIELTRERGNFSLR